MKCVQKEFDRADIVRDIRSMYRRVRPRLQEDRQRPAPSRKSKRGRLGHVQTTRNSAAIRLTPRPKNATLGARYSQLKLRKALCTLLRSLSVLKVTKTLNYGKQFIGLA